MDTNVLASLLTTGTVTTFKARFGTDDNGVRGAVVQIGSPLNQHLVLVVDETGLLREFDRRIMRLA
ncbi:hypothetical protein ACFVJK_46805 [Streptomyces sp. NPDC127172]|uniref:hypothetical protein n=1 Tax=Streptomyces sp. NPDC127172 TaxID=3345382 RepID=UPI003644B1F7